MLKMFADFRALCMLSLDEALARNNTIYYSLIRDAFNRILAILNSFCVAVILQKKIRYTSIRNGIPFKFEFAWSKTAVPWIVVF